MAKNGGFVPTMEMVFEAHPHLFELGAKGGKLWSYPMVFGFAAAMCLGCVCFPQPYMHAYSSRTAKGFKAMVLSFGGICLIIITMPTLVGIASTVIVPGAERRGCGQGLWHRGLPHPSRLAGRPGGGRWVHGGHVNGQRPGFSAMPPTWPMICSSWSPPIRIKKELVSAARWSVAVIMAICVVLAWNPNTPVAELSVLAFGTVAVTIFPLWGAYFWKRATAAGAMASTIVGLGLNLVFFFWGGKNMVLFPQANLFQLNGFLAAFLATGVVFFVVCLVTKPGKVEEKSLDLFFHPSLNGNAGETIDQELVKA